LKQLAKIRELRQASLIIADNLSKAGWSLGCVSAIDSNWRTIWIVDAHRDNGPRFFVRSEEKLTAFIELEFQSAGGLLLALLFFPIPSNQYQHQNFWKNKAAHRVPLKIPF
jgi:hypothetical protein